MANVKQLRLRIKSIKSTKKITKAMHMVSAAKLRKSRIVLDDSILYHDAVELAIHNALGVDQDLSMISKVAFGIESISNVKLLLVIGSDRGLCGSFNHAILRMLKFDIARYVEEKIQFKIITIGKKPSQYVNTYYPEYVLESYNNLGFNVNEIRELSSKIMKMLSGGEAYNIGSCDMYFTSFKNTIMQVPTAKHLLPVQINKSDQVHNLCEIEGENLIENLISMYLLAQLQYALLDSRTSEEASRTIAMDNATRNAGDMIDKLTLVMNRNRQAMITKELIEIISGAEAV